MKKISLIVTITLLVVSGTFAQKRRKESSGNPRAEAVQAAERFLFTKYTKCGDSYFTMRDSTIVQFKDARPTIYKEYSLSEADRLNGVSWAGKIQLSHSAQRTYRNGWSAWGDAFINVFMVFDTTKANGNWRVQGNYDFSLLRKISCSQVPR